MTQISVFFQKFAVALCGASFVQLASCVVVHGSLELRTWNPEGQVLGSVYSV